MEQIEDHEIISENPTADDETVLEIKPQSITARKNIYSRPALKRRFKLYTHESHLIFRHTIKKISKLMYSLYVVYGHRLKDPKPVLENQANIEKHFTEIENRIRKETEARQKLLTQNKTDPGKPVYSNSLLLEVSLTTPQMGRFIDLLMMTDELIMTIDSCWLHGLIDSEVRSRENYAWQHIVLQLFTLIIVTCDEITSLIGDEQTAAATEKIENIPEVRN
jgi:hypothetical protein